jgi:hypothetical protein
MKNPRSLLVLILTLAISFALISCKKDNQNLSVDYFIKGNKDGVAFNFNKNAIAKAENFGPGSGEIGLNLKANATTPEGFDLALLFYNNTGITTGSFVDGNSSPDYTLVGTYRPDNSTTLYGSENYSPSIKTLVVHITSRTSTEVAGTFEGAFYKEDTMSGDVYNEYIIVTDGEFKLPIK